MQVVAGELVVMGTERIAVMMMVMMRVLMVLKVLVVVMLRKRVVREGRAET